MTTSQQSYTRGQMLPVIKARIAFGIVPPSRFDDNPPLHIHMNVTPKHVFAGLQAVWHGEGEGFPRIEIGFIQQRLMINQGQAVELLSVIGKGDQVPSLHRDHCGLVIIVSYFHGDLLRRPLRGQYTDVD